VPATPSQTWVVPGAPLEQGEGWRIWYSRPGTDNFRPKDPDVRLRGKPQAISVDFDLFDETRGLARRMGVMTVRLSDPKPGALYEVTAPESSKAFRWRSLPSSLGEGVSFLMSSCYWRNDDKEGRYGAGITELTKNFQPAFKLLTGDQLYQDWPMRTGLGNHPNEIYAERYVEYWGDDVYRDLLGSSPNFFACDDHEFWNNYPEPSPWAPWSLGKDRRRTAKKAARELLRVFQHGANPEGRSFYGFDVGPVSFFVADPRSERTDFDASPRFFFTDEQWTELETWAKLLQGPGALVLPQPLFQKQGGATDYSLANFAEDYSRLCGLFQSALEGKTGDGAPHDILVLTGDIHTGRHAIGVIKSPLGGEVHEFVASPASLVGPFQPLHEASIAPGKVFPNGRPSWSVWVTAAQNCPTVDNNVAHVRMSNGRNNRIRFELELWRVRPYDNRRYWQRVLHRPKPEGDIVPIFRKEIELR
jgi:hypothetical protein